jgi:hypothetical protein
MEIYVYMDTEPQFAVTEEISKINNVPQEWLAPSYLEPRFHCLTYLTSNCILPMLTYLSTWLSMLLMRDSCHVRCVKSSFCMVVKIQKVFNKSMQYIHECHNGRNTVGQVVCGTQCLSK